ncbi:MAG: hypothetical protein GX629_05905 [Phycisphaerae bacterium]|nr:hypothetical protein [Phycisphaerae bacterium]
MGQKSALLCRSAVLFILILTTSAWPDLITYDNDKIKLRGGALESTTDTMDFLNVHSGSKFLVENSSLTVIGNASVTDYLSCISVENSSLAIGENLSIQNDAEFLAYNNAFPSTPSITVAGKMNVEGNLTYVFMEKVNMTIADNLQITNGANVSSNNSKFAAQSCSLENNSSMALYQTTLEFETLAMQEGSMLGGSGDWKINQLTNQGDFFIGFSPGQVDLDGNYIQQSTATLFMEIGGYEPEKNDRFNITGNALLDGVLDLNLIDKFTPLLNDSFTLMTYTGYSGAFDFTSPTFADGQYFQLIYNDTALVAVVVPEPGVGLLILAALPWLTGKRRGRRLRSAD